MSLVDNLSEYCILLNNELIKENIDSIEKFLNYAFVEIFPVFNEYINSFINLLNEEFTSGYYKIEEYPFYDYFYYSDYLNRKYFNEKLMHIDANQYSVLKYYLENKGKTDKNLYSLDNLKICRK